MRANVWASPQLYQFITHYLESCMRCLLTHGDVGKYRRMVWKCSLKCLAHAPIVLVFLLLSPGQAGGWAVLSKRMSEVNIKNIFLGSGCCIYKQEFSQPEAKCPHCLLNVTSAPSTAPLNRIPLSCCIIFSFP